jgi:hypothetical protein
MTAFQFSRDHACATRPCVSPPFARVYIDPSEPSDVIARRAMTSSDRSGECSTCGSVPPSHEERALQGPRLHGCVVVGADAHPPSGCSGVGVPGRVVAMGRFATRILHGTGTEDSCRLDAYIRLEVSASSVPVPAWRLGPVPAARRTRTSRITRKGSRVWTPPRFAAPLS